MTLALADSIIGFHSMESFLTTGCLITDLPGKPPAAATTTAWAA